MEPSKDEMEMYLLLNGWRVAGVRCDWWYPPKGSKSERKYIMTGSLEHAFRWQQIDEGKISEKYRDRPQK